MEPVLIIPALQKQFERKGYVLLPQLLDVSGLDALRSVYEKYKLRFEGPFHTSHFSDDVVYKQEVHDIISATVFSVAQKHLNNLIPLFGNFMIKNPDPNAGMDLHADWAYVDEAKYTSVAIWIPLVDTDMENGCLGVIEGSHKVTNLIRGPLIRQSTRDRDSAWEKKFGKLLPVKAGDAIVYNHRLLHYSHPNKSGKARPAINLSLASANAEWIHYCLPEGADSIQLYKVSGSDFFIHYTHFQTPQADTLMKTLPKSTVQYIDPLMEKFSLFRFGNKIKDFFKS